MKRTATAVTCDEKTPPSDPPAKKAIVELEDAQSLSLMLMLTVKTGVLQEHPSVKYKCVNITPQCYGSTVVSCQHPYGCVKVLYKHPLVLW